jgi:gliding motility-associated-like protein
LAVAEGDFTVCLDDSVELEAVAPPSGQTGAWTSLDGGFVLFPNQALSPVVNLPEGDHAFVWSLSSRNCPNYSEDTTIVTVLWPQPVAEPDYINLAANGNSINVINNDQLTTTWTVSIQQMINQGELTNLNNGEITVTLEDVTAPAFFIYELCDGFCVNSCDTAIVLIRGDVLSDCPIPNIFTPNDDGVNDLFEIPCVSEQRPARLEVYNRWGDRVYQSDNYLNQWDGTHVGAALPDGTYFYILQLTDGDRTQGSVEIRR